MNEFRAKQVKDGWSVIDDLGEACATYETLREAKREAMWLQGIWDRATGEVIRQRDDLLAACKAALPYLREMCAVPVGGDDSKYGDRQALDMMTAAIGVSA